MRGMKIDCKHSKYIDIFGIVPDTKFGSNKNNLSKN